jgi:ABC-type transport system involved in multi-copper enzyme maturation permease subunit
MTILPVVARELRAAARRRGTHWGRVLVAVLAMVLFVWMMVILLPQTALAPSRYGVFLFRGLLVVGALYAAVGGVVATSDCLSREKREGTLGLLFLTDLRGYDIVLGKLTANSLNTVYALLAIVPVIGLSIQLGGVTYQEVGYAAVSLVNLMLISLAVGMLVSALSRNERKALFASFFSLFAVCFGPGFLAYLLLLTGWGQSLGMGVAGQLVLPLLAVSPLYPLGHLLFLSIPGLTPPLWAFWTSVVVGQGLAILLLMLTSRVLPRVWRARESGSRLARQQERVEQWVYGQGDKRTRLRGRLLDVNPFLWLVHRERGKPWYVWIYLAAVLTTWTWGNYQYGDILFDAKSAVPGLLLIQLFLKIWVISESCTRLAEDRRSGALELLLSTPLTERDIVRGQWLAFRRQFGWPVVCFALFELVVVRHLFSTPVAAGVVLLFVLDLLALGWMGMWLGLTARSTNRAILGTAASILVAPWILFSVALFLVNLTARAQGVAAEVSFDKQFLVWFGIGLLVDGILGWSWARRRLLRHFRVASLPGLGKSWLALAASTRCTDSA